MFRRIVLVAGLAFGQNVTLESGAATMIWNLAGGALVNFHLKDGRINPLVWEDRTSTAEIRMRSHFLCLDRWGAPSEAEKNAGVPFHGEAPRVMWRQRGASAGEAEMTAQLPLARMSVRRTVRLQGQAALVTEAVTNDAPLGRVYNMVQHPTIGPPFLDETTVVDSNARQGFMQASPMPNPEQPSVVWPQALKDGIPVNLRYLKDDPMPNVVSFVVDEEWGWTTAVNPAQGLLIGYIWRASEYPWFNVWRHVENGKPFARGLEFGTTGLHQPYPVLTKKGRIFGRQLFAFLDSGETQSRQYQVFLLKVPSAYVGVNRMEAQGNEFVFTGRDDKRLRLRNLFQ